MRRDGMSYERIITGILMIMATLFFMPVVGMFLICKKDSTPITRAVGAVLLVVGVVIMLNTGGTIG